MRAGTEQAPRRHRRDFSQAEAYAAASEGLSGGGWLLPIRSQAAALLRSRGFPARDEAWKYTRASHLLADTFAPAAEAPAGVSLPEGPWGDAPRLVFVDGIWSPELSQGTGALQIEDLASAPGGCAALGQALGEDDGFAALNRAFLRHGAVVRVPSDEALSELHLVHLSTGGPGAAGEGRLSAIRHVLSLEERGQLQLFEHYRSVGGGQASMTNAATEVIAAAGSTVRHVRILDEGPAALHVGAVGAVVGAGARYALTSVVLGAKLARVEVTARLEAEGAGAELSGLSLLRDRSHVDHHVTVDHRSPGCSSDQDFRSVLDDRARSVYTGAVIVQRGAIGTRSSQLHHALLLSDEAVANTRPWLEIDNDDVSCAHGAAIGSLDEDALFYLRQRGLSELAARGLLTAGFASQILSELPPGAVADALLDRARAWLEGT